MAEKNRHMGHRTLVFLYIILGLFLIVQLFPLYWLGMFSLKSSQEVFTGNILGPPSQWMWSNYKSAISNGKIVLYFFNSLLVTVSSVSLTILLSAMAAYAITRMKWRLSRGVLIFFLMGVMIPLHAALLPLFQILSSMEILNSYLSLIIPYTAFGLPVAIFIFSGFYQSIPYEMEESAAMEGCTILRTFFSIILPLITPAIATVAIFTFLTNWNELMFAVTFISREAYRTLTVGIVSLASRYRTDWGAIGAAMMIGVLPSILFYLLMSKQVQASMRAGAVKG